MHYFTTTSTEAMRLRRPSYHGSRLCSNIYIYIGRCSTLFQVCMYGRPPCSTIALLVMAPSIIRLAPKSLKEGTMLTVSPPAARQFTIFIVDATSSYLGQSVSISRLGFEPREKLSVTTPVVEFQLITQEAGPQISALMPIYPHRSLVYAVACLSLL